MEHHLGREKVTLFRRYLAREQDAKGQLVFRECPNLGPGGCTVHEYRPLSCRLYGHFRGRSTDFFEHCVFRGKETVFPDHQEHLLSPGQARLTELSIEYLSYFPASACGATAPLKEPQTEVEMASHLLVVGQYAEAVQILQRLTAHERSPNLILMLAEGYEALGDYANAISTLDEAITISPDNPELYSRKGSNLLWSGRLLEARQALEQSLRMAPDRRNAHGLLGFTCQLSGDLSVARHHLCRAVELEDEPGAYRLQLGLVLKALGQYEEARRVLTLAQDYEPTREQATLALQRPE